MQLPYSEELNIEYLGRLFDNTSECYKFFWFKAIVRKVIIYRIGIHILINLHVRNISHMSLCGNMTKYMMSLKSVQRNT